MKNYFRQFFNPYYMGGGMRKFHDAAPGDGGGGGGGEKTAEQKLLDKIGAQVDGILVTRGFANATSVKAAIDAALNGLSLEALRTYEADKTGITTSVTKVAGELEKLTQRFNEGGGEGQKRKMEWVKRMLKDDKFMGQVEQVMKTKAGFATLNTRAAIVMDIAAGTTVVDGDIPEDILNSFSIEAFVPKRRPTEFIWEIANRRTVAKITEYKTWLEEGGEEGAFAVIAEGVIKPLVSKTLVRNTTKYRKIAGKRIYTEEFAKFRQEAYNILEDLFNDQLIRNYAAVLVTDLITAAALYVGTALDAQFANPTDYHAIGAVAAQIESLDFMPDLLIINPQDKWRINLSQDSQGRFFVGIPQYNAKSGAIEMMGFRVYTSNRMTVGNFILGESKLYKIEDEPVTIRMGYGVTVTGANPVTAVEADFDHNRFRIIAETFFHNWIASNHDGSFVYANFADMKEALQAPAI